MNPEWHSDSSVGIERKDEGAGKALRILGYRYPAIVT